MANGRSAALEALLATTPLTTDAWVQCDSCATWRRVPAIVAERLGDDRAWFCHQNMDQRFSTCDDAQELEDDEIDVLMRAQERASAGARGGGGVGERAANAHRWEKIPRNVYAHRERRRLTDDDVMVCVCCVEDGVGCGADCLNRLVLSECDPAHCPCGSACQNQRMSRGAYKEVNVKRTGKKGHGLFAAQDVRAGEFVMEYCGEVLHEDAYAERKQRYHDEGRSHYYFMTLSSSETIDATLRGNEGRFLNHSCAPNCETQKWMVRGELRIGIFATRDVQAGEELTIDYKFERFGEKPSRCYCMAGACCGWIGGAKAAEAAKAYNIEDDEDEEAHENDLEPVMTLLTDAQIEEEEARGRATTAERFAAPKKSAVKAESKSWRPPEEIREMERQRKAEEREHNRAERATARLRTDGSNIRRVRAPTDSYASKWSAVSAGAKKRTEVDLKMEDLQGASGGLRSKDSITRCVQLFNLCYPVDEHGVTQVNTRDLGLILEAISLTKHPELQATLVSSGMLSGFQKCIKVLGGPSAAAGAHAALLRKILKILMDLMTHFKELVIVRIKETQTAGGTLMNALGDLRVANDTPLMKLARDFEYQYIGTGLMGPMPHRPRVEAPQQQQLGRNDSGSGSGGAPWGTRSPSSGALNRFGGSTPPGSRFNATAPPRSAMTGGRGGGFNGSAPPGSALGGRGGPGRYGAAPAPPQRESSLAAAMRPGHHGGGYPPSRPNAPGSSSWDNGSERGVKRERDPPPSRPANKPLLTKPLPPQFDDPRSEMFSDAVTAFVTIEVEDLRAPDHPLHDPRANYDRLTQMWSLDAVSREQSEWQNGVGGVIQTGALRQRVGDYVRTRARDRS